MESRIYLTINFFFDYSRDSNGFFDQQERRNALEFSGDMLANQLADDLQEIIPGGINSWEARFRNPSTGFSDSEANLVVPADTIYIFAGARNLSALATGGPGGFSASGTQEWLDRVAARGEAGDVATPPTDFGPWGGQVTFDLDRNWHFGITTDNLEPGQTDFVSVAKHELAHVLGIGLAPSWDTFVVGNEFTGPKTVAEFDGTGNVQLTPDREHFVDGTTDALNGSGAEPQESALDPTLLTGTRKLFTPLDFAALDDIGWTVVDNTTFSINVPADGNAHTIVVSDDGNSSNGRMQFAIDGGSPVAFDVPTNQLIINGGSGADQILLQSSDQLITATVAVNGSGDNDNVTIAPEFVASVTAHGDEGNDILSAVGASRAVTLDGGGGNDQLFGGTNDDVLLGGLGNDTLGGDLGDDIINGNDGNDRLDERANANLTLTNSSLVGIGIDQINSIERARLTGGSSPNVINAVGFVGPSTLRGGASDDTLIGGTGNDKLDGGLGNDELDGRNGNDRLTGRQGNDRLTGGFGDDVLSGNDGDDLILESIDGTLVLRSNRLLGKGTDRFSNVESALLTGGFGNDVLDASSFPGKTTLLGGNGNDTLRGGAAADSLDGGSGSDRLIGNAGNDNISGGLGGDAIFGGSGDDVLQGGFGNDAHNGQSGFDTVVEVADVDMTLSATLLVSVGIDSLTNIEAAHLSGGAGSNILDASSFTGPVILSGLGGDDDLRGGSNNDQLNGGTGDDQLVGGAGDDILSGGEDADNLFGGQGNDLLSGGLGSDVINGQSGSDTLSETAVSDLFLSDGTLVGLGTDSFSNIENVTLTGSSSANVLDATGYSSPVQLLGRGGNDTLRGTAADDTLDGGAGRDQVNGRGGNDLLLGGSNADTLEGGTGDDILDGGGDNDIINGAGGTDAIASSGNNDYVINNTTLSGAGDDTFTNIEGARITGGNSANTLDATNFSGNATLDGGGGDDTLLGGSGSDVAIGGDGDDLINTFSGRDTIDAGNGNDFVDSGNGQDMVDGGDGDDTLRGSLGNDTLTGGLGNDGLSGGEGKDRLQGNAGDDTLIGGAGKDTLQGGAGNDIALGGDDDDLVDGQGGNDTVSGNDGNDTVNDSMSEIDDSFTFTADWLDES